MRSVPLPGSPALRQGLIFGVILAVVQIAFSFLSNAIGLSFLGTIVALLLYLIFGLLAGQRASTQTGRVGTGVLAGFLAGLIGSIISAALSIILTLTNIDTIRQNAQQLSNQNHLGITYTNTLIIQSLVLVLVFLVILEAIIALAGGSIGGFIGKGRAQVPPPPQYEESMFQPPTTQPPPEQYSE